MVIRRSQRHDLGYAHVAEPIGIGPLELWRVLHGADADDRALACIKRGTEWLVPMVPGLVRVMVVPAKSSTVSCPARAFFTICSYPDQNWAKSSVSHFLILGTNS